MHESHIGSDRHPAARVFAALAERASQTAGRASTFILACAVIVIWGCHWANIPIFGYLAARDQYRHNHRDVPDGLPDSKFPEPRQRSYSGEVGRTYPNEYRPKLIRGDRASNCRRTRRVARALRAARKSSGGRTQARAQVTPVRDVARAAVAGDSSSADDQRFRNCRSWSWYAAGPGTLALAIYDFREHE
jgi:hypothetical protein